MGIDVKKNNMATKMETNKYNNKIICTHTTCIYMCKF